MNIQSSKEMRQIPRTTDDTAGLEAEEVQPWLPW